MSLVNIYLKKIFKIRLSPMEQIEIKVRKQYVKNTFKEDIKEFFLEQNPKQRRVLYFLLFSIFSLSLSVCGMISSVILKILSSIISITFINDNFSILLIFLTCLFPMLCFMKVHKDAKMDDKSFAYHIDLEDIIAYAKYFKKDKRENIIKKIVSLICSRDGSMDFVNFECYKDYIEDEEEKLYNKLTPAQTDIVKAIQERIEQDEKNIILNKEKVH